MKSDRTWASSPSLSSRGLSQADGATVLPSFSSVLRSSLVLLAPALGGAAATIASDALMNPFDGKHAPWRVSVVQGASPLTLTRLATVSTSRQAANAAPELVLQDRFPSIPVGVPHRGNLGLLRLVSDHARHDDPLHRRSVYLL